MWRLCSEAIEIRPRIEIRQREVIEIRQGIGGDRANDGQSE
jgi:hypothetical protein